MQFYFIRHGQSSNNALYDSSGSNKGRSYDPELTEIGWRQAALVAEFLRQANPNAPVRWRDAQNIAGFGITHVYCSLMVRAVATGDAIAAALQLPVHAWEDLHEEGGLYLDDEETGSLVGQHGNNRAYFSTHYPRLVLPDTVGEDGWWNRPFEEVDQRSARAQRFLRELLERHGATEDRVAMVSHAGFYNLFMMALLNRPQLDRFWFVLNNVGITRIDFTSTEINVVYMNRLDFLPRDLVT
jgi:2,3-bisphosphoglycerate-dependent phosphoglycerate mutase